MIAKLKNPEETVKDISSVRFNSESDEVKFYIDNSREASYIVPIFDIVEIKGSEDDEG